MANKYLDILNITANGKNQMGLSNTIKRDYGIPLDFTSVQESFDKAVEYAATSTLAYVGQTVAVGGKLYIISETANGTHTVGEGESAKTYDNYLAEVGSKTEGDGNTIELDGQTLKLAGLTGLDNSKTYVPSLVNGKLVWAEPDTSTAEGQAQEINALKVRAEALEKTVNGVKASEGVEAVEGLVDKVAANITAIADEASAREEAINAINDETTGILAQAKDYADSLASDYDAAGSAASAEQAAKDYADSLASNYEVAGAAATAEQNAKDYADSLATNYDVAGAAQEVRDYADSQFAVKGEDAYDDSELRGKIETIESDYLKAEDKYDDTDLVARVDEIEETINDDILVRLDKVEEFFDTAEGETLSDALDTLIEIQKYIDEDGKVAEQVLANKTAIETLNGNDAGSVNKKIADAIAPLATTEALNEVKATAEAATTADEVDAQIDAKITALDLENTYATKGEDAYNDSELRGRIETLEGIDHDFASADDALKTELQGYADGVQTHVESFVDENFLRKKDAYNDSALSERVGAVETAISDINDTEHGILAVAESYADGLDSAMNDRVVVVEEGLAALETYVGTIPSNYTEETVIAYINKKAEETLAAAQGGSSETAASVKLQLDNYKSANDTRVAAIETAVSAAQTQADKGVADALNAQTTANEANTQAATNKSDIAAIIGRVETLETAKGNHETRITSAESKITSLETVTGENSGKINALQGSIEALTNKDNELVAAINNKANAADVYTKEEADAEFMTEEEVAAAIAAIPAIDLTPYAKLNDVNAALELKANAADVAESFSNVYTKSEADAEFMTESEVDDRINALIAAADPEGGKTIENIQNLVKYIDENAGEIAELVTATDANTNKLAGIETTVADYVASQIATVVTPKASKEVTVAEDGTLGLGEVSTDKLVQGEMTLVLVGGSATA